MNAATVIGPRSWTSSLILLDGDEDLGILAPEEDLSDPPRRYGLQLASRVGRAGDGLAVHRQDDIAGLDTGLRGRAVRIDVADERPRSASRQLQPSRDLWCEVAQAHPEPAALRFRVVAVVVVPARLDALLLSVEVELLDGDAQCLLLLVAKDFHRNGASRLRRHDHLHELVAIRHRPSVEFDDDVTGLEPGLLRRAVGQHRLNDRARARPQTELLEALAGHGLHVDADAAANDLAFAELRQQIANRVDRYREADADVALRLAVADDRRVHADHLTADVQQRAAGVAGVDRRVGLQHLVRSPVGDLKRPLGGADDSHADRVRQAERITDRHHPVARLHLR